MKKALILIVCLTACLPILSDPVTADQAREKALLFMNKHAARRAPGVQHQSRDLQMANVGVNQSYYVFNIGDNEGFVIVNGEDEMDEIIGYAEEGAFKAEQMPENMKFWMQSYAEQIEWVRTHKNAATRKQAYATSYSTIQLSETRLARWGQGFPFNDECPTVNDLPTITGCMPTALAQMLYYHKRPTATTSTIPANDYYPEAVTSGTTIDWNNIQRTRSDYVNATQKAAVARLLHFCGQALNANYKASKIDDKIVQSTGANPYFATYVLCKYFGFKDKIEHISRNDYDSEEWKSLIYSELSKERPVFYHGHSATGGHGFLLEGYKDDRFYVNWGWNGINNGFFKLDLLNGYDFGFVGYDINQGAIIAVEPGGDASQYSAKLTTKEISADKKTVNRTTTSGNFPAFNVTTKVENDNPLPLKFKTGFGLYQNGVLVGETWTKSSNTTVQSLNYIEYSMNISLSGTLKDGVYHLCPTSCESSFSSMDMNRNSLKYYIKVTKSGNVLTLETFDPGSVSLTVNEFLPQPGSLLKVNRWLAFDVSVENNNSQAYVGDLKLCQVVTKEGVKTNNVVDVAHLNVAANGTAEIEMDFLPELEGKQEMRIVDKNNKTLRSLTVEFEHAENLEVTDWNIVNGDLLEHVLLGTTLTGSVNIINKDSQAFNGRVWFTLFNISEQNGIGTAENLQLAPNEQQEVSFSFNNLTEGDNYYISVSYDDTKEFCKSESFVCKHLDDTSLGNGDVFTANTIEGVSVTYTITDKNRRTVAVKGVNGTAIDVNTTGPVTLPSVVNGFLVTEIGEGAFENCKQITRVYIPPTVKELGRKAFYYCSEVTQFDGMEGVEIIGEIAFRFCRKVKHFNLPNTLTTIYSQAFATCTSLESIVIPASVRYLDTDTYKLFIQCSNLKVIKVDEGNPYYDSREDCNAIVETATNTLYAGCKTTKIVESIERIGDGAFGLIDNIGTIEIPENVKSIGEYAFGMCYGLHNVKIYSKEPLTIESNVFSDYEYLVLYVPGGSRKKYEAADVWKDFGEIKEFPVYDVEPVEGLQLVVYLTKGRQLSYSLYDRPRFKLVDTDVVFTTDHTELTFEASEIVSFVIKDSNEMNVPTAIRTTEKAGRSRFVEGMLTISEAQPRTPVRIYSTDGKMIFTGTTDETGSLIIDTSSHKRGIYIVNMGQTSFKLIKK